ncbi:MAG: ThiF family adenylyltransferase [Streptosporangiaceae bacterium]|nr:ThiF family adenylyltransferase [Streptosporangiaceae bacterium]
MQWHVAAALVPRDAPVGQVELMRQVRHLRARILFDNGRRPSFVDAGGGYVDVQELDYGAWHFIARRDIDGPPLGYVRLATSEIGKLFQSRAYLGERRYGEVLRAEGLSPARTFEHSRLVVERRARKLGLGIYLNAMAIAAAHCLGAEAMIGTSGTADGQHGFHQRFGFRPVAGTREFVPRYAEDVVIMLHKLAEGAGEYADLVARLRALFPAVAAAGLIPPENREPKGRGAAWTDERGTSEEGRRCLKAPRRRVGEWQPVLYEPAGDAAQGRALTRLLESGQVREVCDTVESQLEELIRGREPQTPFVENELSQAKADQLAGTSLREYGAWAWYPWSARLVHVLPREEFRLVRTDRNRGKIDRPDQRRLFGGRIGVIGLSVGNSAALTLCLEGIGGAFKLADFDTLSLSNLNRLRAGVHHLGLNKTVIAARQMYEIDPYLDIEIYPDGLTSDTMDEFFSDIDLVVEECDTPWVKIAAREQARLRRIPVVMEANDRGLLDIERFDTEPHRPLLHGLLGDIGSRDLTVLSVPDKVALILAMVDADRISPQLAASVPQIGRTLSSWPQLASGVALGGALCAEAARRILLGLPCGSGRFYTDFAVTLAPERSTVR